MDEPEEKVLTGELGWPPPTDVAEGDDVANPMLTPGPTLNALCRLLALTRRILLAAIESSIPGLEMD